MSKKTRKSILNAAFLIALLAATVWMVFRGQDFGEIVYILSGVAPGFSYCRLCTCHIICLQ